MGTPIVRRAVRLTPLAALVVSGVLLRPESAARAQNNDDSATVRPLVVTASRYKFDPPRIEVTENDLVKVQLRTTDIAHSFTVDAYRIAKRTSPGHPVTFEFRADKPGAFPFYCNLQTEEGCRQMRGELIVRPRR